MGRSPTGGFRGGLARGGQKRGRQADFQAAIVQEIEALLGRPAVQGLDFEALETAAGNGRCRWRRVPWKAGPMPIPPITPGRI